MDKSTTTTTIGPAWVLFFIFLVLKLTNVITWSWWWVTSPLWLSFGLVLFLLVLLFVLGIVGLIKG